MRAYFWKDHEDNDCGLAIVAKNAKRAKELGYAYWASDVGVEPETWIEQRVKWQKNANTEGLKEGVYEGKEGLRMNIYGWLEEDECDNCKGGGTLYHHEGKAMCNQCIENSSQSVESRKVEKSQD